MRIAFSYLLIVCQNMLAIEVILLQVVHFTKLNNFYFTLLNVFFVERSGSYIIYWLV